MAVMRTWGSTQQYNKPVLPDGDSHEPRGATCRQVVHLYRTPEERIEEEANIFTLYSLLQVADGIQLTLGTNVNWIFFNVNIFLYYNIL